MYFECIGQPIAGGTEFRAAVITAYYNSHNGALKVSFDSPEGNKGRTTKTSGRSGVREFR